MKGFLTKFRINVALAAGLLAVSLPIGAQAESVLVSVSGGISGYGYGYSAWTNFTAALDAATNNNVTTVSNFSNLAQMLAYDAIMLDQRWTGGSLTSTEVSNITAFIATGRKTLMMGENSNWTGWNNQILGIVGGTYVGDGSGTATAIVSNSLTNLAPTVNLPAAGLAGTASGGTALYSQNFATLWETNSNALTVLDVNVFSDAYWNTASNGQFATNVANWLADSNGGPVAVPEPGTLASGFVVVVAGMGVALRRRRRRLVG